jgi:hypothetical protein
MPTFEITERIAAMVDQLYALFGTRDRGDVVLHEEIEAIVGCDRHTGPYQHCLELLGRQLRSNRRIAIGLDFMVGYRLLTKNEQLTQATRRRYRKAIRQIRKGYRDVACLQGDDSLSTYQQMLLGHRMDQCKRAEKEIRKQMQDHERPPRRSQVNPIRVR